MFYANEVRKVLWITLLLNLLGAGVKIAYGYITGVTSIQADGFHSFFDGASNVIGLIGIWLAAKPPDTRHHYGHKKFETMATIGIAILLFLTCFEIIENAIRKFWSPGPPEITGFSFFVILATAAINIFVAAFEYRKGKALKSDFLVADARHTMSDLLASTIVLISLAATSMGYPFIDPIATLLIAVMIGHLGYDILMEASHVLVDTSPLIGHDLARIGSIASSVEGVRECHNIRVRGRNDAVQLDCHILVSPDMTMKNAHEVAEKVEKKIKAEMPDVVDVVIHLEPQE